MKIQHLSLGYYSIDCTSEIVRAYDSDRASLVLVPVNGETLMWNLEQLGDFPSV